MPTLISSTGTFLIDLQRHIIPVIGAAYDTAAEMHATGKEGGADEAVFAYAAWTLVRNELYVRNGVDPTFPFLTQWSGAVTHLPSGVKFRIYRVARTLDANPWRCFPKSANSAAVKEARELLSGRPLFEKMELFPSVPSLMDEVVILGTRGNPDEGLCAADVMTVKALDPAESVIAAWREVEPVWSRSQPSVRGNVELKRVEQTSAEETPPEIMPKLKRSARKDANH